ncbi:MAG: sodium-dependent transporter [Bacteroidales bacterium]|nr:sodium-dependent transporter [Candidatus Colicola faecequi]
MASDNRFGRLGAVLAAAGSAVGLGNIWKFPYMTGENGGGAFLLIYLACILLFGIPVLSAEFYAGRKGLSKWKWLSPLATLSATIFISFYFVVTGWCFHYLYLSIVGATGSLSPAELTVTFGSFTGSVVMPALWVFIAIALTAAIGLAGIKSGIERASKILMPLLFLILLVLIGYGLTMTGCSEGLRFMFRPDFGKITPQLTLNALSQCFFTLSLGMGVMANYASYMEEQQNLSRTAVQVASLDTLVAILAGLAIFPAVFALGIDPTQGPELVYVTLPSVFRQIGGGFVLQILFFLLMVIAAITTTISIMQAQVSWLERNCRMTQWKAILLSSLTDLVLALLCSLSLSSRCGQWLSIGGTSLYDCADALVTKILFPFGGMIFSIYAGWACPKDDVIRELSIGGRLAIGKTMLLLIRYFIPTVILVIVLNGFGLF